MHFKGISLVLIIIINHFALAQSPVYQPEATRVNDLQHTKLKVDFNFQEETMNGEAWITLSPHFYPTRNLSLDAKGMLIHKVEMTEPAKGELSYSYKNNKLNVELGQTFTRDDHYTVHIVYTARPNEVKEEGSVAISDAKGLYFIDPMDTNPNKPTQIWTQGEPEASSCWFPTIDQLNQKTSQEIYITVPDQFVTLSNGTLLNQNKNEDGTRTDYWKQELKHAPYLFFMGIGDFAVVQDNWKNIPVNYYVEHEYAPYAKEIFGKTPEMISFFSEKFGYEYPWDKYSQMVVRDYVSGAMENTTAVVHLERAQQKHGELVDENIWENTIAHEIAHHWFGDLVTTESWANLTLNESFANYSEYLWREYKYGKASADEHRYEDLEAYFMSNDADKDLVRFYYEDKQDMFDLVSYNKGGYILHMLRNYIGDEAFFTGLKRYLHDNQYKKAEAHQLRLALEEVSGKDLNEFFNQWYFGNGHPKLLVVEENLNGKTQINIKQTQTPLFSFPLTIDMVEDDQVHRQTVWVKKQKLNTVSFNNADPDLIIVNADNDLLAEIEHDYATEDYIKLYNYAKDEYTHRMLAIKALSAVQLTHPQALNTLIKALSDPYDGIREQTLQSLDISSPKVQKTALSMIKDLAQNDPKTLVQATAIESLASLKDKEYLAIFENALQSESYSVQGAGLTGIMNINPDRAVTLADNLDDEVIATSSDLMVAMIPYWKNNNDTSHFHVLTELAGLYALVAFQEPEMAKPAKEAFEWIMESDSPSATSTILNMQLQIYNQLKGSHPMALPYIKDMVKNALRIKVEAAKLRPSKSFEKQIEEIQNTLNAMN